MESAYETVKKTSIEYYGYLSNKIFISSTIGGIIGASIGHLHTGKPTRYMLLGGIGLGVYQTAYSSCNFFIAKWRGDDALNHAFSGAVVTSWAIFGLTKNPRNALIGLAVGGVSGGLYKYSGEYLYSTTREAWITARAKTIHTSQYRVLQISKPKFISPQELRQMKKDNPDAFVSPPSPSKPAESSTPKL